MTYFVELDTPQWSTQLLCLAYMSIELFRYPFYATRVLDKEFEALTWLRYNAWLVCYPVGLLMECEYSLIKKFSNLSPHPAQCLKRTPLSRPVRTIRPRANSEGTGLQMGSPDRLPLCFLSLHLLHPTFPHVEPTTEEEQVLL